MNYFELLSSLCIERDGQESDVALQLVDLFENVGKACQEFCNMCITVEPVVKAIKDWWEKAAPNIYETISNLKVPGYTEKEKKSLVASYKKWGSYAWTINAKQPITAFDIPPISLEDADNKMFQYCTLSNIETMKKALVEHGVNVQDLEEAHFCYQNKKFKSCCLLLFGLIDNRLISYGYPGFKQRKVGGGAIKALKTQKEDSLNKGILIAYLWFENIIEALGTMFKGGDDFRNEPSCINRNYISHGMSERIVTDVDCFKVWSALYSLVVLMPKIEELINTSVVERKDIINV